MPRKLLVSLQGALLLAWLTASTGTEHSDMSLHVFSSLTTENDGQSTHYYPEEMPLTLTCQAPGRKTYWYEKTPQNGEFVQLNSISSSPIAGVENSVYTIPGLSKKDDGRELLCVMDSSSIQEIVKLAVVGQISPAKINSSPNRTGKRRLKCSSARVHPKLELCWYRGEKSIGCQVSRKEETVTSVTVHLEQEPCEQLYCRPRLQNQTAMEYLEEKARARFNEMFVNATATYNAPPNDKNHCREIETPDTEQPTNSALNTTNDTDRNNSNIPPSQTTTNTTTPANTASSTTPSTATSTTTPSTTTSTTTPSTTTSTTTPSTATSRTTPSTATSKLADSSNLTLLHLLLLVTTVLLLGLLITSITSIILVMKSRVAKRSGTADGTIRDRVPGNSLTTTQSDPEAAEYPDGEGDRSEHQWPQEGVPLNHNHTYYYPNITEQVKEEISRNASNSTQPYNDDNHSYNYPVLTAKMKMLLSKRASVHSSSRSARRNGGSSQ